MTPLIPLTRDLVLIGGGHAHALVLRMWGMNPMAGVRLTVINPAPTAPYTGMLPGFIAGHYSRAELNIDLGKLCRFAGARLVIGHAHTIDTANKVIGVHGRPDIGYDVASVDIGIHSGMPEIAGFSEHGIAAKPLDVFANRWTGFLSRTDVETPSAAVIGGGIAGAELALAMKHRLSASGRASKVSLIEASEALTGVTASTRNKLERALQSEGIDCHFDAQVITVEAHQVVLSDHSIPSDFTVGAAGAKPHEWLASTDLTLEQGYISVDETLASTNTPDVFAVGDCAHLTRSPRPKAGVFAVRAAPVLLHNLKARLSDGQTRPFKPQSTYLKLISLGRKSAIAEKGAMSFAADIMWNWKDHIDQKFMQQFSTLPTMQPQAIPNELAIGVAESLAAKPLCGGCGAKVGPSVLADAIATLPTGQRSDVVSQLGDDATILKLGGRRQVVSVDHLRAVDEDPWRMARIATVHALGDVWAMGAEAQSVLVSLILPRMSNDLQRRTLSEIMAGVQSITADCGAEIVGGHTSLGAELTIGLTATGLIPKNSEPITLTGAKTGDALILTRPIGSGTILAAEMAGQARGEDVTRVLESLQQPQAKASGILSSAHAMTDVTGFGLGGHLLALCKASGVGAEIKMQEIPVFDGAIELSKSGHRSSIFNDNAAIRDHFNGLAHDKGDLLFDPQTSGGLLAAVASSDAPSLVLALREAGYNAAAIGSVTEKSDVIKCV